MSPFYFVCLVLTTHKVDLRRILVFSSTIFLTEKSHVSKEGSFIYIQFREKKVRENWCNRWISVVSIQVYSTFPAGLLLLLPVFWLLPWIFRAGLKTSDIISMFTSSEAKWCFSHSLHAVDYSYQLCVMKKEKSQVRWCSDERGWNVEIRGMEILLERENKVYKTEEWDL